ncbi:MAG: signal peptidase I [Coriobacteriales bacterium]|nr:signal peptidase I [Coriobacteriales bacterium]
MGEAPQKGGFFRGVGEFLIAFAVMVGIIMLLRTFVIEPFEIPSGSMLDTIEIGDRIFAEKISVAINHMPTQGEIVTFTNPRDPSQTLIKRVIATEGQTIDFKDGIVYVDGVALDEPYTLGKPTKQMRCDGKIQKTDIQYPYTIPEGYFFAMGDNRTNSSDSRVFGAVSAESVTGHAIFRYWPLFRVEDSNKIEVFGMTFEIPASIEWCAGPML